MNKIDQSKERFLKFKKEMSALSSNELSESDTRSKLIDIIFKDVLGWDEYENITREGHDDSGYYDYQFSLPNFHFIVEAKRNTSDFLLPLNHTKVSVNTLLSEKYSTRQSIEQIRGYLTDIGLEYGVITNGHQFIIGKFYGFNWKQNQCIIFRSLEDIEDRFIEFYNLLSKNSVIEKGVIEIMNDEIKFTKTIYSSLGYEKDSEVNIRNELAEQLVPILDYTFSEIHKYQMQNDAEFISECFVKNKEIKGYQNQIEKLFEDKPPKIVGMVPVRDTDNAIAQIRNEFDNSIISIKELNPPKPIILIGTRGAGKTTFINYFFKVALSKEIINHRPSVYLDFTNYFDFSIEDSAKKIYKDILDELNFQLDYLHEKKTLKQVYFREIRENESLWPDKDNRPADHEEAQSSYLYQACTNSENHFIRVSEYLIRERRIRPCIIFDNVDHLDKDKQKNAFKFAHSLNNRAKCSIFISLREGYFYEWRYELPFNAFINNVYHITAPPYKEILQKRIDFAINKISFQHSVAGEYRGKIFSLSDESIYNFFVNIEKTLFHNENSEMLTYLERTTYPNIREGLESFKHFLVSGHTDINKYIIKNAVYFDNPIPIWEFISAIGLDNQRYYNHTISRIHNLFYPCSGNVNHFTKIRILHYLNNRTIKVGYAEKYVEQSELIGVFEDYGYKESIIRGELEELLNFRLIDSDKSISDIEKTPNLSDHNNLSISLKGYYYITDLITRFHYIDLILQDTPIYVKDYFSEIIKKFPRYEANGKRNMRQRKAVAAEFLSYLKGEENKEVNSTLQRSLDEIFHQRHVMAISDNIEKIDFPRIERYLSKSAY